MLSRDEITVTIERMLKDINNEMKESQLSKKLDACSSSIGISSLQIVKLLLKIEDEYGIEIDIKPNTIEEIVDLILSEDEE